jgi:hypothetical protein
LLSERPAQLGEGLAAFLVERHREGTAGLAFADPQARRFKPDPHIVYFEEANSHDQPSKRETPGELVSGRNSDLSISELLAALQERVNSLFQVKCIFFTKLVFRPACNALDSHQPEQPHQRVERHTQIPDVLLRPVHGIPIPADDAAAPNHLFTFESTVCDQLRALTSYGCHAASA